MGGILSVTFSADSGMHENIGDNLSMLSAVEKTKPDSAQFFYCRCETICSFQEKEIERER